MPLKFSSPLFRLAILAFIVIIIIFFENCNENPYKQGGIYYAMYCQNCHMENGEGLKGLIPTLVKSDFLIKHRIELPCIIRKGLNGNIEVNGFTYGQQQMPANNKLSDFELTNVLNFIETNWGNTGKLWTVDEITEYAKSCPQFQ